LGRGSGRAQSAAAAALADGGGVAGSADFLGVSDESPLELSSELEDFGRESVT
jgi:hypothetical protein